MSPFRFFVFVFAVAGVLLSAELASGHGGSHDDDAGGGEGEPARDLRSKGLIVVKILCLIIVFAATFLGGISPYFCKWDEGFLLVGTQFAGGVFLGTAMIHFLSDSNETFEDLTSKSYPFAFMLACAGYLLTMLADCVILSVYEKRATGSGGDVEKESKGKGFLLLPFFCASIQVVHTLTTLLLHAQMNNSTGGQFLRSTAALTSATSLGDSIMLIVALCFHSVFEGIAIGVAGKFVSHILYPSFKLVSVTLFPYCILLVPENKAGAWKALWTISLHKVFAAIAMGIALLRMIPDRPFLSCAAYAFAFAISSPIGVAIGIIIDATTEGPVADWIYAISMGLACGVFVYVSINHLLAKGYVPQRPTPLNSPFNKFLAVLLGVGVIAVVMIWDT
ncbi:Zinc transporter 11 [Nymphaea thermarum]|nr:Zinc transporter 11 [Nymphaea thermarum]